MKLFADGSSVIHPNVNSFCKFAEIFKSFKGIHYKTHKRAFGLTYSLL